MNIQIRRPERLAASIAAFLALPMLLAACSKPAALPEPVRVVRTTVVALAGVGGTLEYAAEVRARTEVRLGFRVAGKLQSRSAEVGQRVKAGEVLARLDPSDLGLAQEAARAAVQAAQVQHALALADFRRFKDLRDQGFISGAELDRREATLKAAAAQLEQARAQAAVQGNQAAYTALVSQASGVVVGVEAEPGAVLAAGTPVVRVAVDGPRDVVFVVPEDAVAALRALQGRANTLRVRLWTGGEEQAATVREVAAAADPVTRTFQVKADLTSTQAPQLGQTATVMIDQPVSAAAMRVPLSAVHESQGRSTVWVVDPGTSTTRLRPVSIATAQGNEVVIGSGLQPGERVVTAGVHVLTEGQVVRVQGASATAAASAPAATASR